MNLPTAYAIIALFYEEFKAFFLVYKFEVYAFLKYSYILYLIERLNK